MESSSMKAATMYFCISVFLSEAPTVGARTRRTTGGRLTDKNKRGASQNLIIDFEIGEETNEFREDESKLNTGKEKEKEKWPTVIKRLQTDSRGKQNDTFAGKS